MEQAVNGKIIGKACWVVKKNWPVLGGISRRRWAKKRQDHSQSCRSLSF
jgi:hypothetical protein